MGTEYGVDCTYIETAVRRFSRKKNTGIKQTLLYDTYKRHIERKHKYSRRLATDDHGTSRVVPVKVGDQSIMFVLLYYGSDDDVRQQRQETAEDPSRTTQQLVLYTR